MASVLVVDDSAVDRRLVGKLLGEDAELQIEYAEHGADALAKMEHAHFDLIVTDLVMPEMDGLELVGLVTKKYPSLPVVLITGQGNDETAIQALEKGAASYVPKARLEESLLDTVRDVLALAFHKRREMELMGHMAKNQCSFVLENDPELIAPLATHLQDEAVRIGLCGEAEGTRLGVALEEALKNALYRGNLEVGRDLRERDKAAYDALVARRRAEPPYCDRRIHVEAKLAPSEGTFVVRDDGSGFDPAVLPSSADANSLEKTGGRGVLLMRTLTDEVVYNDAGNAVTLIKRPDPETDPA
ncbi:MAG: response regulator [Planctomycetota bacterium]